MKPTITSYTHLEVMDKEILPTAIENKKLFVPNWDNKPPKREPILFVNGIGILTFQNVSCIIAAPGVGKSSICESVCSAVIGTEGIDTLGLSVSSEITKVLYLDNERTSEDVWNSFDRAHRRSQTQGKTIKDKVIDIVGLRMVAGLKERKQTIEALISEGSYDLVIIDGAGDLVNDTNSLVEAIECRVWFRELTSKYKVSILTTLHPNKGTVTPRGHIGSEIMREAETVLGVLKEGEIRTITTDFAHGKSRNAGNVSSSYVWGIEQQMFVSCETPGKGRVIKLEPQELLSNDEINGMLAKVINLQRLPYLDLLNDLKAYLKQNFSECKSGDNVMKQFISYLTINDFIEKSTKGVKSEYYLKANLIQGKLI
jgi:hypothetical protein